MVERFTHSARQLVVLAQDEARDLGHQWIGTEHLLLAWLRSPTGAAGRLDVPALTHQRVRDEVLRILAGPGDYELEADREALEAVGIDVDEVVRRVSEAFGSGVLGGTDQPAGRIGRRRRRRLWPKSGHIPFTTKAKTSLDLSLREALDLRSNEITTSHVLLGVLRADGLATHVVKALGAPPEELRRKLIAGLGHAA